ncbi:MAG TPA: CD225/dispanin family protein [Lysobacter sp.]
MSVPPPYPPSADTPPPGLPGMAIPNYLLWAVLATIASLFFCCIIGTIPGIVAIVFAAQVNRKRDEGNEIGAQQSSRNAKLWCWITTGLCILGLLWTVYFISSGGMARYQQLMEEIEQRHELQR